MLVPVQYQAHHGAAAVAQYDLSSMRNKF